MKRFFLTVFFFLFTISAFAQLTEQQQKKADYFFKITRCPVCDGQPLEGSEAELSQDLKKIIIHKIIQNQSDIQIKKFLTDTYGKDILFEPPQNNSTTLLYYGPYGIMTIIFVFFLIRHYRERGRVSSLLPNAKNHNISQGD